MSIISLTDNALPISVPYIVGVSITAAVLLSIIAILIAFGIYCKLDLLNKIFLTGIYIFYLQFGIG